MKNQSEYKDDGLLARFTSLLSGFVYLVIVSTFGMLFYGFWGDSLTAMLDGDVMPTKDQIERRAIFRSNENADKNWDKVENGIHLRSGMAYDENFELVHGICTACHSAKLITQNRATEEGWTDMIRWMQATQGLGDLGKNEPTIVQYLGKHYAPKNVGRRQNIDMENIEWYEL